MATRADIELSAQLTALRYAVELLFANGFVQMKPSAVDAFIEDATSRPGWIARGPVDADEMTAIDVRSGELVASLLDAARDRTRGRR